MNPEEEIWFEDFLGQLASGLEVGLASSILLLLEERAEWKAITKLLACYRAWARLKVAVWTYKTSRFPGNGLDLSLSACLLMGFVKELSERWNNQQRRVSQTESKN